ncbi:MAG: DUF4129 domain-containing protein [Bacteroidota bacterium]
MLRATRQRALSLLILSLISVLLLAGSLSLMRLEPGMPFPGAEASLDGSHETANLPAGQSWSIPILQGVFALIFLALVFYLPVRLVGLASLKRIFGFAMLLALLFVLISLLPRFTPAPSAPPAEEFPGAGASPATEFPVSPLGEPPRAVIWLVLAGMGMAVIVVAVLLSKPQPSPTAGDALQQEAMKAVQALDSGRAFKDVIVESYMRMVHVLQEEQGMQRDEQMTVREFESSLVSRGVPEAPVHQLTGLFEKVRYGRQAVNEEDRALGIESLNQVIRFCGRGRA